MISGEFFVAFLLLLVALKWRGECDGGWWADLNVVAIRISRLSRLLG